ncbi:hypothetical protein [Dyadobacter luticola]|uniref:hypothetical protein n=1 Tax=Dyadobacter luticola TaxID=1979387 RepID=UPI00197A9A8C|nr:hypothetical protein [Dyadobacter luticola]
MAHRFLLIIALGISLNAFGQREEVFQKSKKWYLPDHMKLQFAGGVGFLSGGPGYSSRNKTLETDILFGFLPQKFGGDALVTITGKTTYSPWRIPVRNEHYIVPASIGFYLSYTFGPQFDSKWPSYYPKGYYWWATSFRPGAYIGGKVGKNFIYKERKRGIEAYYELGTYDLLLVSYAQNRGYLHLRDIVNLAIGIKYGF